MESVQIEKEINEVELKLDELRQQHKIALKVEDQREFLRSKKQLLNDLSVTEYPPSKIGGMAGMTNLNDFCGLISLHLGYQVSVPQEVGGMSISQLLVAVDVIQNDERFQKYRGDLFTDGLEGGL